jgi:hypothetical protein
MRFPKVIAGALLATVVGAVGVSLASGGSGAKPYTACYKADHPNAGWVKLINEPGLPTSCPWGYTAFQFNQQAATGTTGPAGPAGPAGPSGAKGDTGATGATGATGPAGAKGDTGDTGPAGPVGPKGDPGEKGEKGDKGERGASNSPDPEQFRNYSVNNNGAGTGCVLVRAATEHSLVITYVATTKQLSLHTDAACATLPLAPELNLPLAIASPGAQTFTPGFTVPPNTPLYAAGQGHSWINGYAVS